MEGRIWGRHGAEHQNDQTQQLSRELAGLTGETVTTAVTIAVRERLDRLRSAQAGADERAARILTLGGQIAAVMPPDAP